MSTSKRDLFFQRHPQARERCTDLALDGQWHDIYILFGKDSASVYISDRAAAQLFDYNLKSMRRLERLVKQTGEARRESMLPYFSKLKPQLTELDYALRMTERCARIVQQGSDRMVAEFHYDQDGWKDCLGWLSDQFTGQFDPVI